MIDFPHPILCVASDVVKELDGEDAVLGLWTLFTKCKASLTDGQRLENISWRLWYREMACHGASPHSSGSVSPADSEFRSSSPITPVSEDGPTTSCRGMLRFCLIPCFSLILCMSLGVASRESSLMVDDIPTARSWHGENLSPSAMNVTRRLSTASMPARPNTKPGAPPRAGKLIVGILPDKLIIPHRMPPSSQPKSESGTNVPNPTVVNTPQGPIAQPRPVLPAVQLPATTPPSASGSAGLFPRVVVVHPTPHPTPPATPQPTQSVTAIPVVPAPTHLLLPPVQRSAFTANQPPEQSPSIPPEPKSNATPTTSDRPKPKEDVFATIKPSDRRFYLQHSESPDRQSTGSHIPEGNDGHTDADVLEPSPSSGTSSHVKSDGIMAAGVKRALGKAHARRSKEAVRHIPARPIASRLQAQRAQAAQRRTNEVKRTTTFNIGSASSNGSKHASSLGGGQKSHAAQPDQDVPRPRPPSPLKNGNAHMVGRAGGSNPIVPPAPAPTAANRRGLVMNTSSEYETTSEDEDDSEWASDNDSPDEQEIARKREESRLREAAEEAQRQRDMFAKVPKRSYSNLNRTRSGLLSQLLNPDPNLFPPNHPYRTSYSSQDVTQLGKSGRPSAPAISTSKSTVAVPLANVVNAQVPPTSGGGPHDTRGYRPKGRPEEAELEDDSDSDEENPENAIQVSRSLAQQKLAALADPNRRRNSDRGPPPPEPPVRPNLTTVHTAPIPLGHPYNLPAPAPPMTPRTTRRQMLSTELSESLRRNLLWERQVSKINMTGGARRGGLLGSGLRPLTAVNNAQPTAGGSGNPNDRSSSRNEGEERRRAAAIARNHSWGDDYHYAGW
ncbi:unnamed protein product [Somion occarium]|uniref:Nitrogen regulatory protein areA GATA-like domain-containing protein n=1 Tax=Somion occarium TaxID=3059160 RepID=A0ABP1EBI0_9APHY